MQRRIREVGFRAYQLLPRRARRGVLRLAGPTFTVGALCVIERPDGRILLVRHSYRRRWGLPGGLVKRGEEIDVAARREAHEEVGIDIELVGEPAVVVAPRSRRVDVIYRARVAPGVEPDSAHPVSAEIVEVRWTERSALPELQHEASGGLVALARRFGG